jgi:hypothetical protein
LLSVREAGGWNPVVFADRLGAFVAGGGLVGGGSGTIGAGLRLAAMAGALAGARLGAAVLPAPLLERLTDRGAWGAADLDGLARDCAHLFTRSVPPC